MKIKFFERLFVPENPVCDSGILFHRLCGQLSGEGVSQMTILLHKTCLVKVSKKGEGVKIPKNLTTWFIDNPLVI